MTLRGADAPSTGDQLRGSGHDRECSGRGAHYQVHEWGVDRDRRDGGQLPADDGNSSTLRAGRERVGRPRGRARGGAGAQPRAGARLPAASSDHALAYARATHPETLEAVTVNVDEDTRILESAWEAKDLRVPLKVLESPYREITRPVLQYVKRIRRDNPRDLLTVFIPEYVIGHWWEQLLHNQSGLRLKSRLLFQPGVMVTSVPWQLESSERVRPHRLSAMPGAERRGLGAERNRSER